MNKTNTRAMVETAFVSAIGVMLGAISVYVPGFAFLAFLVTPAAIGIIGTKWGRKYSISAAVITRVTTGVLASVFFVMVPVTVTAPKLMRSSFIYIFTSVVADDDTLTVHRS